MKRLTTNDRKSLASLSYSGGKLLIGFVAFLGEVMQKELPDFDTLKNMAENDPEALEALRQQHVEALIENAPRNTQRRLRGLQFQIDAQRSIHQSPMAACIKLSQMMYESFSELRMLLNEFSNEGPNTLPKRSVSEQLNSLKTPAQVLHFQRRQSI